MMVSTDTDREPADVLPIRNGVFIAVVGPSGAGKDTVIAHARSVLAGEPNVEFVRRVITRPCDGTTEDHDTLDEAGFAKALSRDAFPIAWRAHGLSYGLPASVDRTVDKGQVAVANVSRGVIGRLRERYLNVAVVEITASPEILAARLAGRARETHAELLARMARTVAAQPDGPNIVKIDNSGPKEVAGDEFVAVIRKAAAFADVSARV